MCELYWPISRPSPVYCESAKCKMTDANVSNLLCKTLKKLICWQIICEIADCDWSGISRSRTLVITGSITPSALGVYCGRLVERQPYVKRSPSICCPRRHTGRPTDCQEKLTASETDENAQLSQRNCETLLSFYEKNIVAHEKLHSRQGKKWHIISMRRSRFALRKKNENLFRQKTSSTLLRK